MFSTSAVLCHFSKLPKKHYVSPIFNTESIVHIKVLQTGLVFTLSRLYRVIPSSCTNVFWLGWNVHLQPPTNIFHPQHQKVNPSSLSQMHFIRSLCTIQIFFLFSQDYDKTPGNHVRLPKKLPISPPILLPHFLPEAKMAKYALY